jgi:hypothetical protein
LLKEEIDARNAELAEQRLAYELAINTIQVHVKYATDFIYTGNAMQPKPTDEADNAVATTSADVTASGDGAPVVSTPAVCADGGAASDRTVRDTADRLTQITLDRRLPLATLLTELRGDRIGAGESEGNGAGVATGLFVFHGLGLANRWHIGDEIMHAGTSTLDTAGITDGMSVFVWSGNPTDIALPPTPFNSHQSGASAARPTIPCGAAALPLVIRVSCFDLCMHSERYHRRVFGIVAAEPVLSNRHTHRSSVALGQTVGRLRCVFSDKRCTLDYSMVPTPARLKLLQACDQ